MISRHILPSSWVLFAIACGGSADQPARLDPPAASGAEEQSGDVECAPTNVIVAAKGTIARPSGRVLKLEVVYRGESFGVRTVEGLDKTVGGGSAPLTAGKNSGFWYELRSPSTTIYTRTIPNLDRREAPGATAGTFENARVERCEEKSFLAEVPNDASATELVVFGNPDGAAYATELARFAIR